MTPADLWGIVCPGPSLRDSKTQELIRKDAPEHLAAVNGAILAPLYPFDIWVASDPEVFESCINMGLYIRHDVLLLCPSRWGSELVGTHAMARPYGQFPHQHHSTDTNADFAQMAGLQSYPTDIRWLSSTVLIAIGLLLARGARRIAIYGADMAGKGYFRPGLDNSRTRHTPERWEEEKRQLVLVASAAAERGIHIVRRT